MVRALAESGHRVRRLPLQNRLMLITRHQYDEDIRLMHQIADELAARRRRQRAAEGGGAPEHEPAERDMLDAMLEAADPQTGEKLSDENIRYQIVTFLIAGHETTSGLLSFALYELLRHPEALERARGEVENVLGDQQPHFEHLAQLTYLDQVLKETLRLWPTAPAFAVYSKDKEMVLGGQYPVRQDESLFILTPMLHRDPAVWGPDAEQFNPDNFEFENAEKLPPNAWKPFGNGQRSCIGRPFALQEATLVLAMILQRFDLALADANYQLTIKETLTLKPQGLFMRARRRDITIAPAEVSAAGTGSTTATTGTAVQAEGSNGIALRVLFGSNAGSSEAFAQRIASDGRGQGYEVTTDPLDAATGNLPREGAVVIVTSSYEGQPPDNARQFVSWLDGLQPGSLDGVRYAIFGCGNKDWARTYQAIPQKVDEKLAEAGAERLVERGEANARGDFFGDFDRWYAGFWPKIAEAFGQGVRQTGNIPQFEVEFVQPVRDPLLRQNKLEMGTIVENRELVNMERPGARSKRHVEIALPPGVAYRAGDYLAVLPLNHPENVDRALRRFGLAYDAQVVIRAPDGGQTFFPTDKPVTAGELLASYVELTSPATRRQIEQLAVSTTAPEEKAELDRLLADEERYNETVLERRVCILDLLEQYRSSELPFAVFLQMQSPLKPRQYSISSSPLWSPDHCTLTVSVVNAPALSGHGRYYGAASSYLAQARAGTRLPVTVRPSNVAFHPPESLDTPIVMVCAGSGLAPFRGFIQDRAMRAEAENRYDLPPWLLFFGCNHPDEDYLYGDELAEWEARGLVSVRPAFSAQPTQGPDGEIKFVQDRLWQDRVDVIELVKQGATLFVCGDGRYMAPAVHETCTRMYQEATGATPEAAEQWMTEMERTHARYVADVFA